jgi:type I restriction enzyme S subunit
MNKEEVKTKLEDNKLPKGWQRVRFKDVAENKKFAIVDGPFGTQLHADEYLNEGIPVVRVTNLSFNGKFLEEKFVFINKKKANILKRSEVIPGDIIIAKTGATIGKSGIFPTNLHKGIIASSCVKFTTKRKIFSEKYILYFITWYKGQRQILNSASGSTRTTINIVPFSNIEIYLPLYLSEQCKIAEILEAVDETIDKTDAIIEKYMRIKQGLMQDLFTKGIDEKGNIRSEKTHKFKDSPLGRIPEEWNTKTIKEICSLRRGASPRPIDNPAYFADSGRGWIRISDVTATYMYLKKTDQYLSNLGESLSVKVNQGDLIMSICATIGKPVILDMKACIHDGFVFFDKLKEGTNTKYLFYYLASKEEEINRNKQIGTQGNLNTTIVNNIFIPTPKNSKEQEQIAEILTNIDNSIDQEYQKLLKLKRIKGGLMQNLLTGEVRVKHLTEEGVKNV